MEIEKEKIKFLPIHHPEDPNETHSDCPLGKWEYTNNDLSFFIR